MEPQKNRSGVFVTDVEFRRTMPTNAGPTSVVQFAIVRPVGD